MVGLLDVRIGSDGFDTPGLSAAVYEELRIIESRIERHRNLDPSLRTEHLQEAAVVRPHPAVEDQALPAGKLHQPGGHHIYIIMLRREQRVHGYRLRLCTEQQPRGRERVAADIIERSASPGSVEADVGGIRSIVVGERAADGTYRADRAAGDNHLQAH